MILFRSGLCLLCFYYFLMVWGFLGRVFWSWHKLSVLPRNLVYVFVFVHVFVRWYGVLVRVVVGGISIRVWTVTVFCVHFFWRKMRVVLNI